MPTAYKASSTHPTTHPKVKEGFMFGTANTSTTTTNPTSGGFTTPGAGGRTRQSVTTFVPSPPPPTHSSSAGGTASVSSIVNVSGAMVSPTLSNASSSAAAASPTTPGGTKRRVSRHFSIGQQPQLNVHAGTGVRADGTAVVLTLDGSDGGVGGDGGSSGTFVGLVADHSSAVATAGRSSVFADDDGYISPPSAHSNVTTANVSRQPSIQGGGGGVRSGQQRAGSLFANTTPITTTFSNVESANREVMQSPYWRGKRSSSVAMAALATAVPFTATIHNQKLKQTDVTAASVVQFYDDLAGALLHDDEVTGLPVQYPNQVYHLMKHAAGLLDGEGVGGALGNTARRSTTTATKAGSGDEQSATDATTKKSAAAPDALKGKKFIPVDQQHLLYRLETDEERIARMSEREKRDLKDKVIAGKKAVDPNHVFDNHNGLYSNPVLSSIQPLAEDTNFPHHLNATHERLKQDQLDVVAHVTSQVVEDEVDDVMTALMKERDAMFRLSLSVTKRRALEAEATERNSRMKHATFASFLTGGGGGGGMMMGAGGGGANLRHKRRSTNTALTNTSFSLLGDDDANLEKVLRQSSVMMMSGGSSDNFGGGVDEDNGNGPLSPNSIVASPTSGRGGSVGGLPNDAQHMAKAMKGAGYVMNDAIRTTTAAAMGGRSGAHNNTNSPYRHQSPHQQRLNNTTNSQKTDKDVLKNQSTAFHIITSDADRFKQSSAPKMAPDGPHMRLRIDADTGRAQQYQVLPNDPDSTTDEDVSNEIETERFITDPETSSIFLQVDESVVARSHIPMAELELRRRKVRHWKRRLRHDEDLTRDYFSKDKERHRRNFISQKISEKIKSEIITELVASNCDAFFQSEQSQLDLDRLRHQIERRDIIAQEHRTTLLRDISGKQESLRRVVSKYDELRGAHEDLFGRFQQAKQMVLGTLGPAAVAQIGANSNQQHAAGMMMHCRGGVGDNNANITRTNSLAWNNTSMSGGVGYRNASMLTSATDGGNVQRQGSTLLRRHQSVASVASGVGGTGGASYSSPQPQPTLTLPTPNSSTSAAPLAPNNNNNGGAATTISLQEYQQVFGPIATSLASFTFGTNTNNNVNHQQQHVGGGGGGGGLFTGGGAGELTATHSFSRRRSGDASSLANPLTTYEPLASSQLQHGGGGSNANIAATRRPTAVSGGGGGGNFSLGASLNNGDNGGGSSSTGGGINAPPALGSKRGSFVVFTNNPSPLHRTSSGCVGGGNSSSVTSIGGAGGAAAAAGSAPTRGQSPQATGTTTTNGVVSSSMNQGSLSPPRNTMMMGGSLRGSQSRPQSPMNPEITSLLATSTTGEAAAMASTVAPVGGAGVLTGGAAEGPTPNTHLSLGGAIAVTRVITPTRGHNNNTSSTFASQRPPLQQQQQTPAASPMIASFFGGGGIASPHTSTASRAAIVAAHPTLDDGSGANANNTAVAGLIGCGSAGTATPTTTVVTADTAPNTIPLIILPNLTNTEQQLRQLENEWALIDSQSAAEKRVQQIMRESERKARMIRSEASRYQAVQEQRTRQAREDELSNLQNRMQQQINLWQRRVKVVKGKATQHIDKLKQEHAKEAQKTTLLAREKAARSHDEWGRKLECKEMELCDQRRHFEMYYETVKEREDKLTKGYEHKIEQLQEQHRLTREADNKTIVALQHRVKVMGDRERDRIERDKADRHTRRMSLIRHQQAQHELKNKVGMFGVGVAGDNTNNIVGGLNLDDLSSESSPSQHHNNHHSMRFASSPIDATEVESRYGDSGAQSPMSHIGSTVGQHHQLSGEDGGGGCTTTSTPLHGKDDDDDNNKKSSPPPCCKECGQQLLSAGKNAKARQRIRNSATKVKHATMLLTTQMQHRRNSSVSSTNTGGVGGGGLGGGVSPRITRGLSIHSSISGSGNKSATNGSLIPPNSPRRQQSRFFTSASAFSKDGMMSGGGGFNGSVGTALCADDFAVDEDHLNDTNTANITAAGGGAEVLPTANNNPRSRSGSSFSPPTALVPSPKKAPASTTTIATQTDPPDDGSSSSSGDPNNNRTDRIESQAMALHAEIENLKALLALAVRGGGNTTGSGSATNGTDTASTAASSSTSTSFDTVGSPLDNGINARLLKIRQDGNPLLSDTMRPTVTAGTTNGGPKSVEGGGGDDETHTPLSPSSPAELSATTARRKSNANNNTGMQRMSVMSDVIEGRGRTAVGAGYGEDDTGGNQKDTQVAKEGCGNDDDDDDAYFAAAAAAGKKFGKASSNKKKARSSPRSQSPNRSRANSPQSPNHQRALSPNASVTTHAHTATHRAAATHGVAPHLRTADRANRTAPTTASVSTTAAQEESGDGISHNPSTSDASHHQQSQQQQASTAVVSMMTRQQLRKEALIREERQNWERVCHLSATEQQSQSSAMNGYNSPNTSISTTHQHPHHNHDSSSSIAAPPAALGTPHMISLSATPIMRDLTTTGIASAGTTPLQHGHPQQQHQGNGGSLLIGGFSASSGGGGVSGSSVGVGGSASTPSTSAVPRPPSAAASRSATVGRTSSPIARVGIINTSAANNNSTTTTTTPISSMLTVISIPTAHLTQRVPVHEGPGGNSGGRATPTRGAASHTTTSSARVGYTPTARPSSALGGGGGNTTPRRPQSASLASRNRR